VACSTALLGGALTPARADEQPLFALHALAVDAYRGFGSHELAVLIPMLGLIAFAAVTAVLLVRTRARAARLESAARDEIAGLRDRLDRAQALLLAEPQVIVDWPAASENPGIEGEPDILGVGEPHRVLAFGSWLDAAKASASVAAPCCGSKTPARPRASWCSSPSTTNNCRPRPRRCAP
jgi:hypothetical protein